MFVVKTIINNSRSYQMNNPQVDGSKKECHDLKAKVDWSVKYSIPVDSLRGEELAR